MVEPVTLGVIVAALIAKTAERATDRTVEGGESALRRLAGALRERFSGAKDDEAQRALELVEAAPDSARSREALATVIDDRAVRDPALRSELEELVAQARAAGVDIRVIGDQNVIATDVVASQIHVSYGRPPSG
jgi:hypothetical protein